MHARAFLKLQAPTDLDLAALAPGTPIPLQLTTATEEVLTVNCYVPSAIFDGVVGMLKETPHAIVEGDLRCGDSGFGVVVRGFSPCLDSTYQNTVMAVGGCGPEGRVSQSGKTVTRGVAIGEGETSEWLNARVANKDNFREFISAAAGSRVMLLGALAMSTTEGAGGNRDYFYLDTSKALLITPGGKPAAPSGSARLVAGEGDDLPI